VAELIPFVIHPTWLEGPGTDLPDGEISYLIERTSLFIYLMLLRAQHHMQWAIREGAVEQDHWDFESFPLFYIILDRYIATISIVAFNPPSYPSNNIVLPSQITINHSVSSPPSP
jgi:hypothetical protein